MNYELIQNTKEYKYREIGEQQLQKLNTKNGKTAFNTRNKGYDFYKCSLCFNLCD